MNKKELTIEDKFEEDIARKPNLLELLQTGYKNSFKTYKGLEIYEKDTEAVFYDREKDKIMATLKYTEND